MRDLLIDGSQVSYHEVGQTQALAPAAGNFYYREIYLLPSRIYEAVVVGEKTGKSLREDQWNRRSLLVELTRGAEPQ